MPRHGRLVAGIGLSLLVLGACGDSGEDEPLAEESRPTVRATENGDCDYSGEPLTVGISDVDVVNDSDRPLYVTTLRLDEGRTFAELEQSPAELELPDFVTIGPRTFEPIPPGRATTEELAFTEAGEHGIVCAVDKPPSEVPVLAPQPLTVEPDR